MGENYTHLWKQKKKALYGERVNIEEGENQNKITSWTSKKNNELWYELLTRKYVIQSFLKKYTQRVLMNFFHLDSLYSLQKRDTTQQKPEYHTGKTL